MDFVHRTFLGERESCWRATDGPKAALLIIRGPDGYHPKAGLKPASGRPQGMWTYYPEAATKPTQRSVAAAVRPMHANVPYSPSNRFLYRSWSTS